MRSYTGRRIARLLPNFARRALAGIIATSFVFIWAYDILPLPEQAKGLSYKAPEALASSWYPGSWQYRRTITVDHTKVTDNTTSSTAGANSTGTGVNDTGIGTLAWTNPDYIYTSNNTRASVTSSGTSVSNYLKASNFGFNIPAGATIQGITVGIERIRNGGSTGAIQDSEVKIVKSDGTIGSTNKAATGVNWPTSEAYRNYGDASDLWGESWTYSDINDADFGVVLAVVGTTGGTNRVANVDHIRITVTYVLPDHQNFPVLVSTTIPSWKFTSHGGNVASSTGADILFTSSDGVTKLDHEIEYYSSSTGELVAWVEVPTLQASSNTVIYAYYGNADAVDQSNPTGVWDGYAAVWHLADGDSTAASYYQDSTSNNRDGTLVDSDGDTASEAGKIGGALNLSGDADYVNTANIAFTSGPFIMSAWVKHDATTAQRLFSKTTDSTNQTWLMAVNNTVEVGTYDGTNYADIATAYSNPTGTWHHIVGRFTTTNVYLYIDGAEVGTPNTHDNSIPAHSATWKIGGEPFYSEYTDGIIDEARLSTADRSPSWIATEYENQSATSTFYAVGDEEATSPAGIALSGVAYQSEGGAILGSKTVNVYKNGTSLLGSTTTDASTGAWSITDAVVSSGDTVTVYVDGDSTDANTVIVSNGIEQTDIDLYGDTLIIRHDTGASITNADLHTAAVYGEDDMIYATSTGNAVTLDSDAELHVFAGDVYAPGASITTQGSGGFHLDDGATATLTATSAVGGSITVDDGATLNINADLTVSGGGMVTSGTGTITTTSGTPTVTLAGTGAIGGGSNSLMFYNLTGSGAGTITSNSTTTISNNFTAGSKTWVFTTSGTPLSIGGTFAADTSVISFRANADLNVPNLDYYDLELAPSSGSRTYSLRPGIPNDWYGDGWTYRKTVTIEADQVPGASDLTDFPVLISVTDSDLAAYAKSDGFDILFTSSDGSTKLSHEVEKYVSATGELAAWVKVPTLGATEDTVLYMYYGNAAATDQSNAAGVWSGYAGVWHLNQGDSTATGFYEDSAGSNHCTLTDSNGNTIAAEGKIDGALNLAGDQDMLNCGSDASIDGLTQRTVSFWARRDSDGSSESFLLGKIHNSPYQGWGIAIADASDGGFLRFTDTWSGSVFSTAVWEASTDVGSNMFYGVVTYDSSSVNNDPVVYVNGSLDTINETQSPGTSYIADGDAALTFGGNIWADPSHLGIIDEVRYSNTVRSADWISTEYNNQSSTSTFYTIGVAEQGADAAFAVGNDLTLAGNGDIAIDLGADNIQLVVAGDLSIGSGDTVSASGAHSLHIGGDYANSGTFTHNNGSVIFEASGAASLSGSMTGSSAFYGVMFEGDGGVWTVSNNIEIRHDLSVATGTLDFDTSDPSALVFGSIMIDAPGVILAASADTLTFAGNFTNNGTFTHNGGTVILDGSDSTSVISGDFQPEFFDFTSAVAGKTILFAYGTSTRFFGTLTIAGASGNPAIVRSTQSGTQWLIDLSGTALLDHSHVIDSGCSAGSNDISLPSSVRDGGNNGGCWIFTKLEGKALMLSVETGSGGGTPVGGGGQGGGGGSVDGGSGGGEGQTGGGQGGGGGYDVE